MSTPMANVSDGGGQQPWRVGAYVDYYGLKSLGWRRYYWLDLRRLAENLLRPSQSLTVVRYFTARFEPHADDPDQHIRQDMYLEALETLPDLTIQYGYHLPKTGTCRRCGATWETLEEKMTDVNIAMVLLGDAQNDVLDTAMVISADSDLASPASAILRGYPGKRGLVAFPPNRSSELLRQCATAAFTIGRKVISDSQLPLQVVKSNGYVINKPSRWN